ncbi:zinc-binding dehydrogenase [Streptomyces sp. VRA16 Mangrove soil]|uniref:zinc-binding dehydrogenase n=1 Tax=Streptomyces sp. VRA16 Mangrove soil TaxID=2817434 RepID=UPI001A9F5B09|nr:zinc-binding dehydrogenase [Streptomyces sp. VRA16 Mangrove soil]MBO1337927.1 zinc-binding dehydrogenase [Streptomyces sp. VRA16 Mangrove soil]
MHAVRLHAFGPAENLTYETAEDPEPGPGGLRIAVEAAGVHLLDTALRQGFQGPLPALPELPTIPGREVAGTVESLGPDTDPGWLGKRVVVHLGTVPGGYAELAVADADRVHEIPAGLDAAQAVALIGTGRTALGILNFTAVTAETVALVPAAAGGIGTLLVQYVKHAGGTVIGLAGGPEKTKRVAANGADLALDYKDPQWPARVREFLGERRATVLFDGVGGETTARALDLLGPGGQHLIFGWSAQGIGDEGGPLLLDEAELARRGITQVQTLGPAMMRKAGGDNPMRTLESAALDLGARGVLVPAVDRFPLSAAAAAHRALETRGTTGKVVLDP